MVIRDNRQMVVSGEVLFILFIHVLQVASCEAGLATLLHKVWAWCQLETPLMITVLSLLATYTARCPQGKTISCVCHGFMYIPANMRCTHSFGSILDHRLRCDPKFYQPWVIFFGDLVRKYCLTHIV